MSDKITDPTFQSVIYTIMNGDHKAKLEIERKWDITMGDLVHLLLNYPIMYSKRTERVYLSVEPEIRCSIETRTGRNRIAKLTYKTPVESFEEGLVRREYTKRILPKEASRFYFAEVLAPWADGRTPTMMVKTVYRVDIGESAPQYLDISVIDDIIIAEMEFKTEGDASDYRIPQALLKILDREVTYDPNYQLRNIWLNKHLPALS